MADQKAPRRSPPRLRFYKFKHPWVEYKISRQGLFIKEDLHAVYFMYMREVVFETTRPRRSLQSVNYDSRIALLSFLPRHFSSWGGVSKCSKPRAARLRRGGWGFKGTQQAVGEGLPRIRAVRDPPVTRSVTAWLQKRSVLLRYGVAIAWQ